jgi:MFS family permease
MTAAGADIRSQLRARVNRLKYSVGGRPRRRVILVLASVLGLSTADSATVGASATELRHALHVSNAEIGVLIAITSGIGVLATVPLGALVDRVNRVRLLGTAIALWAGAMAASALATSFEFLCITRVALGVTLAVGGPAVASLLGDFFPHEERSRIYGLVLTGEIFGAGAGFVISSLLASISWRATFACLVPPSLVVAWFVWRLPEPARGGLGQLHRGADTFAASSSKETNAPEPQVTLMQAVWFVLRVRTNLVLVVSGACSYFFFAGVRSFGVEFATGQYRVSHAAASGLTIVVGFGAVAGVLIGGRLGDRIESRRHPAGRIIVGALALEAAAVFFVPGLAVTSTILSVSILMVAAAALGAVNPPIDAARLEIMPAYLWGRAEGIRSVLQQGAQALAPVLFGVLADNVAGGGQRGLQVTFYLMLIPLVAAGGILMLGIRTYPRDVARLRSGRAPAESHPRAAPVRSGSESTAAQPTR